MPAAPSRQNPPAQSESGYCNQLRNDNVNGFTDAFNEVYGEGNVSRVDRPKASGKTRVNVGFVRDLVPTTDNQLQTVFYIPYRRASLVATSFHNSTGEISLIASAILSAC